MMRSSRTSGTGLITIMRPRAQNTTLGIALATCAWVSLNPYFFWNSNNHYAVAGLISAVVGVIAIYRGGRVSKADVAPFVIFATFIVYISVLPKADGTMTRWYFVLPTFFSLAVFSPERRIATLEAFAGIFAASLVPSILVEVLTTCGLPLTLEKVPHSNPIMAAAGSFYLVAPGAVLMGTNSVALSWGGTLFRICGVYDEPGMVGTVGAFILAANRFDVSRLRHIAVLVGGILSFSLAFSIMTSLGFAFRAINNRSINSAALAILSCLVGLMSTSLIRLPVSNNGSSIYVYTANSNNLEKFVPAGALRDISHVDNRSLPEMNKLMSEYYSSNLGTLLFGISADASVQRGGVSQFVGRLLTDYGLVGTSLLVAGLITFSMGNLKSARSAKWTIVFLALFVASMYQRPIIWMPYAALLLVCGAASSGNSVQERIRITNRASSGQIR